MPGHPFQLSTRQLAVVVLYGAVGAFAVTPLARITQVDGFGVSLGTALVVGTVVVLLTWSLMLRLNPWRRPIHVWLSNLCLLPPVAGAAIGLTLLLVMPLPVPSTVSTGEFLDLVVITLILGILLVILVRRVWPRPCPSCRRRGLIPESRRHHGLEEPVQDLWPIASCLHCGTRARRLADGWTVEMAVIDHLCREDSPSVPYRLPVEPVSPRA